MSVQKFMQRGPRGGPGGQQPAADAGITDVPVNLLDSFLPGFSIIRRLIEASLGFDITVIVSSCFIAFAVLSAGRYIWRLGSAEVAKSFTSSIVVRNNDKLFTQIMYWISKQTVTDSARRLTATTRGSRWEELDGQISERAMSDEPFNFSDWDASISPLYAPSFGSHWFFHKGRLFFFRRVANNARDAVQQNPDEERETIHISCLGRSTDPLKELLHDCKKAFTDSKRALTIIRHPAQMMRNNWHTATRRPSRPMNTVYLDEASKDELLQDAREFLHPLAPKFYARRGIPYRRGYLFYGPPGTGKTSLSLALAGMFGLELYVLSLSDPSMSDQRLGTLFSALSARCVVLLEDVDAVGLDQRNLANGVPDKKIEDNKPEDKSPEAKKAEEKISEEKSFVETLQKLGLPRRRGPMGAVLPQDSTTSVTLSGLLNAIDGVASQEGRILVMTTNDPESLDKALIRPGRVDLQVYFGNVNKENTRLIFERMYSRVEEEPVLPSEQAEQEDYDMAKAGENEKILEMAAEFAEAIPDETFTPAEVQGFLLTRRKSPKKALAEVHAWRDELIKSKASGKNVIRDHVASRKPPETNGPILPEVGVKAE